MRVPVGSMCEDRRKGGSSRDVAAQTAIGPNPENFGGRNSIWTVPRGSERRRVRMRRDTGPATALARTPAIPASAAIIREGVGATGVLLPQLAPEQPDGNVGGPAGEMATMLAGEMATMLAGAWLPLRSACGMKPPSTTAARTTRSDQRQRRDITPNFRGGVTR
jgi:hypothetical protein